MTNDYNYYQKKRLCTDIIESQVIVNRILQDTSSIFNDDELFNRKKRLCTDIVEAQASLNRILQDKNVVVSDDDESNCNYEVGK